MATRGFGGRSWGRYRLADRKSKGRALDELVALTGFHRNHAVRVLPQKRLGTAVGFCIWRGIHDEAVSKALVRQWEAAGLLVDIYAATCVREHFSALLKKAGIAWFQLRKMARALHKRT